MKKLTLQERKLVKRYIKSLIEGFLPNKTDKFLLYRLSSLSPSPGHGEYLFVSGNTLDELFDNWIEKMRIGGYGYKGAELERERSKFNKLREKYWNHPASFYKLKVK